MANGDAKRLVRALKRTKPATKPVEYDNNDPLLEALRRRGIVAPPEDRDDNRPWWQVSRELAAANQAADKAAEARKKSPQVQAPKSAAQLLSEGLRDQSAGSGKSMPLNGAQVLRAALGGTNGTINGGNDVTA